MFECFSALALLELGYPDRSAEKMAAGLALARELGHPQTLVVAGHVAAQLHQLRGEASLGLRTRERGDGTRRRVRLGDLGVIRFD